VKSITDYLKVNHNKS